MRTSDGVPLPRECRDKIDGVGSTPAGNGLAGPAADRTRDGGGAGDDRPAMRGWRRLASRMMAGGFFVLAVLGVVLPGLPATPFLLLTSYFLVRSSPRLNAALLESRLFGPLLTDWQVHGGIRTHVRVKALVVVAVAVPITLILADGSPGWTLAVLGLVAIGIITILRLPAAHEIEPEDPTPVTDESPRDNGRRSGDW